MPDGSSPYRLTLHGSIAAIPAAAWDACAGADNPFVSHAFLLALEESRSAVRDSGWLPQHAVVEDESGSLLAAAPIANPKAARARQRTVLQGELPSPIDPPAGCPFHSRCPIAQERCKADRPALRPVASGALAACHFV